jgi:hypothetical protein
VVVCPCAFGSIAIIKWSSRGRMKQLSLCLGVFLISELPVLRKRSAGRPTCPLLISNHHCVPPLPSKQTNSFAAASSILELVSSWFLEALASSSRSSCTLPPTLDSELSLNMHLPDCRELGMRAKDFSLLHDCYPSVVHTPIRCLLVARIWH